MCLCVCARVCVVARVCVCARACAVKRGFFLKNKRKAGFLVPIGLTPIYSLGFRV